MEVRILMQKECRFFELLKTLNPQIIAPGHSSIYIGGMARVLLKGAKYSKRKI